jgi:phosphoglycerate dehydrogenase-like enzyme
VTWVWLPYPDAVDRMGGVPDGIDVDFYDGSGDLPSSADEVQLWVPPYVGAGPVVRRVIPRLPRLRVLQLLTAGVDSVRSFVPSGVTLCNARGVHDASTAELAVALMLASLRGLPDFVRAQEEGRWVPAEHLALADRTVLLVGYGSIGQALERRLDGFETHLLRVARRAKDGVEDVEALPDLLPRADVVVLLLPMTDATRGLVDEGFLSRMHDGALLVNVSRGPIVRTDALLAELESGRLRAALDVTDPEPLPAGHPLWKTPGLLLSPHVGGNTSAFLPRAYRLLSAQLRRFAAGDPLENVVTGDY